MGKRKSIGELFEGCHFDREISWTATQHPIARQITGVTTLRAASSEANYSNADSPLDALCSLQLWSCFGRQCRLRKRPPSRGPIYRLNPPSIPLSENLDSSDTDMH